MFRCRRWCPRGACRLVGLLIFLTAASLCPVSQGHPTEVSSDARSIIKDTEGRVLSMDNVQGPPDPPLSTNWQLSSGSAATTNSTDHGSHTPTDQRAIFFIAFTLAMGAATRVVLRDTGLPYTVVLILQGLGIGTLSRHVSWVADYTTISDLDPHLLLFTFLPVLLFESAFSLEYHVFHRSLKSILVLAVPGVIIATFLTSLVTKFVFPYAWSWSTALLLGAILSATDPVAVVALLRELGASKTLATLIEGESLLNDGTAIVVFLQLLQIVTQEEREGSSSIDVGGAVLSFLYVALVGPIVGIFIGKLATVWLSLIYKDALVEITITLSMTYLTYYVAEDFLKVSGVLATVAYGLYINAVGRTRISSEVEHWLHRFYEMMAYLANTMIFVLAGVIAGSKATFDWIDIAYLLLLYVCLHVIRAGTVLMLGPAMQSGYGLGYKEGAVLIYGGLRGSVGLALALVVTIELESKQTGDRFLFHTAGIVVLTLVFNGTSIAWLLGVLGMNDVPKTKMEMIRNAQQHLDVQSSKMVEVMKRDAFLSEADWDQVRNKYQFRPRREAELVKRGASKSCLVPQPNPRASLTKSSIGSVARLDDVRVRYLKAMKQSYWHQFEEGVLGHNAVLALSEYTDVAIETPGHWLSIEDLGPVFQLPPWLTTLYDHLQNWPYVGNKLRGRIMAKYFLAFHIGQGFVTATEDVAAMVSGLRGFRFVKDKKLADEVMDTTEQNKAQVISALTRIRMERPEIVLAIKTVFAAKKLLNHQQSVVAAMVKQGSLAEDEGEKLLHGIEQKSKYLHFTPPVVSQPEPETLLKRQTWLSDVSEHAINAIIKLGKRRIFQKNELLTKQGQDGRTMYLLVQGFVKVERGGRILAREGPGTVFGELSIVSHRKRTANVVAETTVDALILHQKVLHEVMAKFPHVEENLWDFASRKMAATYFTTTAPWSSNKKGLISLWVQNARFVNFATEVDSTAARHAPFTVLVVYGRVKSKTTSVPKWVHTEVKSSPVVLHGPMLIKPETGVAADQMPKLLLMPALGGMNDGNEDQEDMLDMDELELKETTARSLEAPIKNNGRNKGSGPHAPPRRRSSSNHTTTSSTFRVRLERTKPDEQHKLGRHVRSDSPDTLPTNFSLPPTDDAKQQGLARMDTLKFPLPARSSSSGVSSPAGSEPVSPSLTQIREALDTPREHGDATAAGDQSGSRDSKLRKRAFTFKATAARKGGPKEVLPVVPVTHHNPLPPVSGARMDLPDIHRRSTDITNSSLDTHAHATSSDPAIDSPHGALENEQLLTGSPGSHAPSSSTPRVDNVKDLPGTVS